MRNFTAFKNTPVVVQTRNKPLSEKAAQDIQNLLNDLDREFSATRKNSTVSKINDAKAGENVPISPLFLSVAEKCGKLNAFTDGKFDPSIYPLSVLWQFSPTFPVKNFRVPENAEILAAAAQVGYDKFSFGEYAVKTADDAKLDFGGSLKGYAADKIGEIMVSDGINEGYVTVGTSSLYLVSVNSLSVVHPRKSGNILSVNKKMNDLSVSTSGDYEKNYTVGGKTYSHIIDPVSGYPQNTGVASATIIGKNGLELDALTTAICLYRHDFSAPESGELYSFLLKISESKEYSDAQIFVVCINGENKQILTNEKQGEDFTLFDKDFRIINI